MFKLLKKIFGHSSSTVEEKSETPLERYQLLISSENEKLIKARKALSDKSEFIRQQKRICKRIENDANLLLSIYKKDEFNKEIKEKYDFKLLDLESIKTKIKELSNEFKEDEKNIEDYTLKIEEFKTQAKRLNIDLKMAGVENDVSQLDTFNGSGEKMNDAKNQITDDISELKAKAKANNMFK